MIATATGDGDVTIRYDNGDTIVIREDDPRVRQLLGDTPITPAAGPSLSEVATTRLAAIQVEKCRARDGGFLVDGVLFDSDQAARTAYLELALRFQVEPTFSTRWKASSGVWVTMDATLFGRIQEAGTVHIQAAFAWQEARDAEVAAILAQVTAGTMTEEEARAAVAAVSTQFE